MSRDLGYRAMVIAGNIPNTDLPTKPGEWQIRTIKFTDGHVGKEMFFGCPLGRRELCGVTLLPDRQKNGAGWHWDGDMVNPTLGPSINCQRPTGCGWHGFCIQGRFQ